MAKTLKFSGEACIEAAASGDLPSNDVPMILGLKDELKLGVTNYQHGMATLSGGEFAALDMGSVESAVFLALRTDGANAVRVKFNGGSTVIHVDGFISLQAEADNPITGIQVASTGATIEYLITE